MRFTSPLVALVTLTVFGVACTAEERTPFIDETHYTEALWADAYETIGELAGEADLVVVSVVEGPAGSLEDTRTVGAVTSSLIFTDFRVKAREVIKGSVATDSFLVHQTGGITSSGARMEISDDPLFEAGATYLLFLGYNEGSNTCIRCSADRRGASL